MQFDLYAMPRGRPGYVVDVQAHLLRDLGSRVVVPVVPVSSAPKVTLATLNPILPIGGVQHVLLVQNIASVPVGELRQTVGSLDKHRDDIIRALDALLSGI